jgi:hypothetical protein
VPSLPIWRGHASAAAVPRPADLTQDDAEDRASNGVSMPNSLRNTGDAALLIFKVDWK